MRKVGTIIVPPGVFVSVQEKRVADYIALHLYEDVTFLLPRRQSGAKTPDIEMAGQKWEIKCPRGKSSRTIENNLRAALRQSQHIILDLRGMDGRVPTKKLLTEASRQFQLTRKLRHLIVITREEKLIDFAR